jgi:serine/threonine protein kinase
MNCVAFSRRIGVSRSCENDTMAVDEERVQAVFRAALQANDPVQEAAILDRECASEPELRQSVEALLGAYRKPAAKLDPATADPLEVAQTVLASTMAFDLSSDKTDSSVSITSLDQGAGPEGRKEEDEPLSLAFLQPSTRPGSLGRLGHNEVLEVLGKGGFGIVVRAFDESLHRVVAIKVLSPQLATASPARKRFLREARASARVRHANVVQIYAVEEQPLPYLVMEYIPGQTLQQRLDRTGPLDVPDVLKIGAQIARGLAAAHEQGLVHRDIKPANILLESGIEQNVKISDFGLARAADDASLSQSGVIAGTPLFMAPEQAKGNPPDPRADLFSLGSVMYTMASGRPPFRANTPLAVLKRVAEDTPRPIRQIIPEVPQWLCDVISRLHAKNPADRFQSAAEVAVLLEQHLAHLRTPALVPQPPPVKVPGQPTPRRIAILAIAAAGLGVLGVMMGSYAFWRSHNSTPAGPAVAGAGPGADAAPARTSAAAPTEGIPPAPPVQPRTIVVQGRPAVSDALIDFSEPDRSFGATPRDNPVRRAEKCNAFLARFDLGKLDVPPQARVAKATASFYVWDPSSAGKTKVCAFPLKMAWDEVAATWQEPAVGKSWQGGKEFTFGVDTGPESSAVVVEPEQGSDTADPPIEYQLDVTEMVRAWQGGTMPNHGMAVAPVIDPSVDGGILSRFQLFSSEHTQQQFTPKLTVEVQPNVGSRK